MLLLYILPLYVLSICWGFGCSYLGCNTKPVGFTMVFSPKWWLPWKRWTPAGNIWPFFGISMLGLFFWNTAEYVCLFPFFANAWDFWHKPPAKVVQMTSWPARRATSLGVSFSNAKDVSREHGIGDDWDDVVSYFFLFPRQLKSCLKKKHLVSLCHQPAALAAKHELQTQDWQRKSH